MLGKDALVAVRSSATSEDSKTASFAGQQATFLNVTGSKNLIKAILGGWASLFESRALFYRHEEKLNENRVAISLVIQKMVNSESSGVMFTIDPVTLDKSNVVIEAIYGLGEYIVGGKVTPDHYVVDKDSLKIVSKKVEPQKIMLTLKNGQNKSLTIENQKGSGQKIDDQDIVSLATLGKLIEKHYNYPQDIEWAKEGKNLYIVQTRPVTTLGNQKKDILLPFIEELQPDILCLQETKANKDQVEIDLPQYEEYWYSADKKGYSGTAIFTKKKAKSVLYGLPEAFKNRYTLSDTYGDALTEGRVLTLEFETFYINTV
jgi:phosphoenolpyruvate synthase/pyruvate phosphate dikinase